MQNTETWEEFQLKRKNDAIRWLLVALLAFTAIAGVILASVLLPSCVAFAGEIPEELATHCIQGEGRREYLNGDKELFKLLAEAIRNRNTTKGVNGCRPRWNRSEALYRQDLAYCKVKGLPELALKAWRESKHTNFLNGATLFGSRTIDQDYLNSLKRKGCKLAYRTKTTDFYHDL